MRAKLLSGINKWLNKSGLTQTEAAEQLGVTQARVSEIKNGKINRFSLSMLVRLAQRAGLRPCIKLSYRRQRDGRDSRTSAAPSTISGWR
jgi:predicted XRE-type DNA-binding protein